MHRSVRVPPRPDRGDAVPHEGGGALCHLYPFDHRPSRRKQVGDVLLPCVMSPSSPASVDALILDVMERPAEGLDRPVVVALKVRSPGPPRIGHDRSGRRLVVRRPSDISPAAPAGPVRHVRALVWLDRTGAEGPLQVLREIHLRRYGTSYSRMALPFHPIPERAGTEAIYN